MIKKSFLTLLLSSLFWAQPAISQSNNDILKEIQGIAAYNATILGYAINCNFNKSDVENVKNQFLGTLQQLNLTKEDADLVKKSFFDTLEIAKQKGPENSGMVCFTFKQEFEKIANSVKTGRVVN